MVAAAPLVPRACDCLDIVLWPGHIRRGKGWSTARANHAAHIPIDAMSHMFPSISTPQTEQFTQHRLPRHFGHVLDPAALPLLGRLLHHHGHLSGGALHLLHHLLLSAATGTNYFLFTQPQPDATPTGTGTYSLRVVAGDPSLTQGADTNDPNSVAVLAAPYTSESVNGTALTGWIIYRLYASFAEGAAASEGYVSIGCLPSEHVICFNPGSTPTPTPTGRMPISTSFRAGRRCPLCPSTTTAPTRPLPSNTCPCASPAPTSRS